MPGSRTRKTPQSASAKKATAKKATAKKAAAKKATTTPAGASDAAGSCFVIMPFGPYFDLYFTEIFKPGIDGAGLQATRADDLYRPSAITHDIWDSIQTCKVLVADLTGKNPNVFYELGLAHAARKPAVLLTQSMDDVPFDLRALRVLEYDVRTPSWAADLQERITHGLLETLESPEDNVLPSFLRSSADVDEADNEEDDPVSDLQRKLDGLQRQVNSLVSNQPSLLGGAYPVSTSKYYTDSASILRLTEPRVFDASKYLVSGAIPPTSLYPSGASTIQFTETPTE